MEENQDTPTQQPNEATNTNTNQEPKLINETLSNEMDALLNSVEQPSIQPQTSSVEAPAIKKEAPAFIEESPVPVQQAIANWPNISSLIFFTLTTLFALAAGPGTYIVAKMVGPFGWVVTMGYLPFLVEIACQAGPIIFGGFIACLVRAKNDKNPKSTTIQTRTIFAAIQVGYVLFALTAGIRMKTIVFIITNCVLAIVPLALIPALKKLKSNGLFITAIITAAIIIAYSLYGLFRLFVHY
ncbi:hypothetical protein J6X90_02405 [Candidatus Saccharibacteria bacterium]|nr:hypothetical protein [Candidatus Saccharibacteria bacterium]